jgi:RNA polymerase sigma-70 factor, ECF subfamily
MADESHEGATAASGDAPARAVMLSLEAVFREHAPFVANTLRRFGVAQGDLSDQLQEVFMVVHGLRHDYDPARPLRPWLFGITYRVAARYRQKKGRQIVADGELDDRAPDPGPLADVSMESKEAQALVLDALERIDLSRRAVFIMADIDGEPVPEIAVALQIPLNTAYSRLRLAREEFSRAVRRLLLARGESP